MDSIGNLVVGWTIVIKWCEYNFARGHKIDVSIQKFIFVPIENPTCPVCYFVRDFCYYVAKPTLQFKASEKRASIERWNLNLKLKLEILGSSLDKKRYRQSWEPEMCNQKWPHSAIGSQYTNIIGSSILGPANTWSACRELLWVSSTKIAQRTWRHFHFKN